MPGEPPMKNVTSPCSSRAVLLASDFGLLSTLAASVISGSMSHLHVVQFVNILLGVPTSDLTRDSYTTSEAPWVSLRGLDGRGRGRRQVSVGRFDARWGAVAESFVEPGRIPPVDPAHRGELDLADVLPDPLRVDQLRLIEAVHGLGQRVIEAISHRAD